jgi:hypothetical protein
MGRADLIGNGKHHLIPSYQPKTDGTYQSARRKNSTDTPGTSPAVKARLSSKAVNNPRDFTIPETSARTKPRTTRGSILTQHTGLPPRAKLSQSRKKKES